MSKYFITRSPMKSVFKKTIHIEIEKQFIFTRAFIINSKILRKQYNVVNRYNRGKKQNIDMLGMVAEVLLMYLIRVSI